MIHNKYFEILEHFLGNYAGEIYGRMLIGKVSLSQKAIALALAKLEEEGMLKSRSQGAIKYYRLNLEYSEIKDIIVLLELARKVEFLSGHRNLAHIFREDDRIVGVFGSYARGVEKENSDVDVFVVGGKKKGDYDEKGELLDLDISIKYFTPEEWKTLLNQKNRFLKEIANNHVLMFGAEGFVTLLWGHYYGFG